MELTLERAQEYLASIGISLPDFVLQIYVTQADGLDECLTLHYDPATALLIKLYLLGLLGISGADKYVSSESAPSGASRSYRYHGVADRWRGTLGLLQALDKFGCAAHLIPADPTVKAFAGLWVARGGCMEGGR